MQITLDQFASYTDHPGMNVTDILLKSSNYADRLRVFTVSSRGGAASNAPYDWGIPSAKTLSGGGAFFSAECWLTGVALADARGADEPLGQFYKIHYHLPR